MSGYDIIYFICFYTKMSTEWSKITNFYVFWGYFIWLVVRVYILRLYKDNTFGVKNTVLGRDESG